MAPVRFSAVLAGIVAICIAAQSQAATTWASVAVGDADNDGVNEVIAVRNSDGDFFVFDASPEGSFSQTARYSAPSSSSAWADIAIGDVDNDGRSEVVAVRNLDGDFFVYDVDTSGAFTLKARHSGFGAGSKWAGVAIENVDGLPGNEIIAVRNFDALIFVLKLTPSSTFQEIARSSGFGSGSQWAGVAAGDVDDDGAPEIVGVRNFDGDFFVFELQGNSLVTVARETRPGGRSAWADLTIGDVDNDGRNELVAVRNHDANFSIYDVDPAGEFNLLARECRFGPNSAWADLAIGDADNGGSEDLVSVRNFDGGFFLFRVDPGGTFQQAGSDDSLLVFRARGTEQTVRNKIVSEAQCVWKDERPKIETAWEDEVNGTSETFELGFTFTMRARDTSVSLPTLPTLNVQQGIAPGTVDFSVAIPVSWSTIVDGPQAGALKGDCVGNISLNTTLAVSGTIGIGQHADKRYFVAVSKITPSSATAEFTIPVVCDFPGPFNPEFNWPWTSSLVAAIDSAIETEMTTRLNADNNYNGVADLKEPVFVDDFLPDQDIVFPVYEYLAAGGQIPFELSTENGSVVVEVRLGDPVVGSWLPHKTEHPRLLYDASQRLVVIDRVNANFQGWYDRIRAEADKVPVFPRADELGVISEADWQDTEVPNARIALSAALAFDVGGASEGDLLKSLRVLFRFQDSINDPLFSHQWGQNSLYAAETLTLLSQAYDLLLGRGFPSSLTGNLLRDSIEQLPPGAESLAALAFFVQGNEVAARDILRTRIERRLKRLRDVIHLQTHIWDLAGSPNHSMRNAGALGVSALLFNTASDAYENISLASTVLWKRLGVATGLPFSDPQIFAKAIEGFGFAEGPHYLAYSAELYLPFMLSYSRFIAGEQPLQEFLYNDWTQRYQLLLPDLITSERVRKAHDWSLRLAMPDGFRPPVKDTDQGSFFYSGLLANAIANPDAGRRHERAWDFANSGFAVGARLVDTFVTFDPALAAAATDPSQRLPSPTQVLTDSGNVVFRSGWDDDATYMHLLGDNTWQSNGIVGGMRIPYHQQADNTSFLIHAHGELLALDAGYGGFPMRHLVTNPENHNLVLVDGDGPKPTTTASIPATLDTKFLDYAQVSSQYNNADVARHMLFIDNSFFMFVDALRSAHVRTYDWQLHGAGRYLGDETPDLGAAKLWWAVEQHVGFPSEYDHLLALLTTTADGVDSIAVDPHSPHFDAQRNLQTHTAVRARETDADVAFVGTIYPSTGETPFSRIPPTKTFSVGNSYAGVVVGGTGERRDLLLARHPDGSRDIQHIPLSVSGVPDIHTDADVLLLTLYGGEKRFVRAFARNVGTLIYNGRTRIATPNEMVLIVAGDIDGDTDVDRLDLALLLRDKRRSVDQSRCGVDCDLDGDGMISMDDARQLVLLCTQPRCAVH